MKPLTPIEVLHALHTGPGAVVTLHVREGDKFLDVASLRADQLREKLPFVSGHLKQDSYFSINSTYEQHHVRESDFGFQVYSRREKHLRWLNAIALDLDAGHDVENFDCAELKARFFAELEHNELPAPTLICESGRGMWALWLLKDHRDDGRVPAHDRCRKWHKRIGQAIARRFAHLAADVRCHDCSRIMRFPGSMNSSAGPSGEVVQFFRCSDAEYTLPDLGPHFGIRPRRVSLAPVKGPKDAAKQSGGYARWGNTLAGFRQLVELRGGFSAGCRRNAVYLLAVLLRYNRSKPETIAAECLKLAQSCIPSVPIEEVTKRIDASRKVRGKIRHDTFIRMLNISAEEVAQLPTWFKPRRRENARQKVHNRRAVLTQAIKAAERVFSVRESVLVLRARGFSVSHGTVASDLRAIRESVQLLMLEGKTPYSKFKHKKLYTTSQPAQRMVRA